MTLTDAIRDQLQQMAPISLDEMNAIRLMNRIDTKFITSAEKLLHVLKDADSQGYRVCEIDGGRLLGYESLYADTPELSMYVAHHNGKKVRQKIRTRTYLISGISYLEIKQKNNKGRTRKQRMEIPRDAFGHPERMAEACAFIRKHSAYPVECLTPSCTTAFQRMTLVNAAGTERLTIDLDIQFDNRRTGRHAALPDAVIIELKQDGRGMSEMKSILRTHRIKPMRVSKYCLGIALTAPQAKHGRFKEKIRRIEKTTHKNSIIS